MSTKTLMRLLAYLLAIPLTATACSGGGATVVQPSQPATSAQPSAEPSAEPSGAAYQTQAALPLVALGTPIVVHTMGTDVPLVYTVTLSNLRTGVTSGNTVKPTKGQFIMVDVKIHADTGRFSSGSPGMFNLVLADGTVLAANLAATPAAMPGVKTVWVQSLDPGGSFAAQLLFDAPLKLAGCKIEVAEISGVKGGWILP